mmetsp:Transcript_3644/g.14627  ORF Transcript_3644/g.14627 Transcript_3644/m.14627 type:complete len:489 (+) Transcript_3644:1782-3248(+)
MRVDRPGWIVRADDPGGSGEPLPKLRGGGDLPVDAPVEGVRISRRPGPRAHETEPASRADAAVGGGRAAALRRDAGLYPVDDVVETASRIRSRNLQVEGPVKQRSPRAERRANLPLQQLKLGRERHAVGVALREEGERRAGCHGGRLRVDQPGERGREPLHQQRHLARDVRKLLGSSSRSDGSVDFIRQLVIRQFIIRQFVVRRVHRVAAEDHGGGVDGAGGDDERLERRPDGAGGEGAAKRVVFARRRVVVVVEPASEGSLAVGTVPPPSPAGPGGSGVGGGEPRGCDHRVNRRLDSLQSRSHRPRRRRDTAQVPRRWTGEHPPIADDDGAVGKGDDGVLEGFKRARVPHPRPDGHHASHGPNQIAALSVQLAAGDATLHGVRQRSHIRPRAEPLALGERQSRRGDSGGVNLGNRRGGAHQPRHRRAVIRAGATRRRTFEVRHHPVTRPNLHVLQRGPNGVHRGRPHGATDVVRERARLFARPRTGV